LIGGYGLFILAVANVILGDGKKGFYPKKDFRISLFALILSHYNSWWTSTLFSVLPMA